MADNLPTERRVGIEFRKFYAQRLRDGFIAKYLSGENVLDIGYRGRDAETVPITERAIGIGLDFPGYDGTHLPFGDYSQDAVLASHMLEHTSTPREVLADWYRVLKVGGYLVIFVPHQYLYERRPDLPPRWNASHHRFYTPAKLLAELEDALPVNGFRVRHLRDNDDGYPYDQPADIPPAGGYEIELVVEKISRPPYSDRLRYSPSVSQMIACLDQIIMNAVADILQNPATVDVFADFVRSLKYFTPWQRLRHHFLSEDARDLGEGNKISEADLKAAVRPLLEFVEVDEAAYLHTYPKLHEAHLRGELPNPAAHWREWGYFKNRFIGDGWN